MGSNKSVSYIDFGFKNAEQFWTEIVLPAYERFTSNPTRQHAMEASVQAWHVQDWIWHEQHPGEETKHNDIYNKFKKQNLQDCPQLAWICDVADASKHRGLSRLEGKPKETQKMRNEVKVVRGLLGTYGFNQMPFNAVEVLDLGLTIVLNDGTKRAFNDILSAVINHWRMNYFS
jgi:hypothetical protein